MNLSFRRPTSTSILTTIGNTGAVVGNLIFSALLDTECLTAFMGFGCLFSGRIINVTLSRRYISACIILISFRIYNICLQPVSSYLFSSRNPRNRRRNLFKPIHHRKYEEDNRDNFNHSRNHSKIEETSIKLMIVWQGSWMGCDIFLKQFTEGDLAKIQKPVICSSFLYEKSVEAIYFYRILQRSSSFASLLKLILLLFEQRNNWLFSLSVFDFYGNIHIFSISFCYAKTSSDFTHEIR